MERGKSASDVSFPVRSSTKEDDALESGELGLDAAPLGQGAVLGLVLKGEEEYHVSMENLFGFYLNNIENTF